MEGLVKVVSSIFPLPSEFAIGGELRGGRPQEVRRARLMELAEAAYDEREQQFGAEHDADDRAGLDAAGDRPALDPAPDRDRRPARGHRPARLRPAGSARRVQARSPRDVGGAARLGPPRRRSTPSSTSCRRHGAGRAAAAGRPRTATARTAPVAGPRAAATKVGRNEPCPCGSGRKYKKCHGRVAPFAVLEPRGGRCGAVCDNVERVIVGKRARDRAGPGRRWPARATC